MNDHVNWDGEDPLALHYRSHYAALRETDLEAFNLAIEVLNAAILSQKEELEELRAFRTEVSREVRTLIESGVSRYGPGAQNAPSGLQALTRLFHITLPFQEIKGYSMEAIMKEKDR